MDNSIGSIREIVRGDIPWIVDLHRKAFPGFLMTLLGPTFLSAYYRCVIEYPGSIFMGIFDAEGMPHGFVAGFCRPAGFYRRFQLSRRRVALASIFHVAVRPWLWMRVLENIRLLHARSSESAHLPYDAELASIAVDPETPRMGYGQGLVHAFMRRAWQEAMTRIVLTTDACNNDAVNRFYESLGFDCVEQIDRPGGRRMNKFVYERDPNVTLPAAPYAVKNSRSH